MGCSQHIHCLGEIIRTAERGGDGERDAGRSGHVEGIGNRVAVGAGAERAEVPREGGRTHLIDAEVCEFDELAGACGAVGEKGHGQRGNGHKLRHGGGAAHVGGHGEPYLVVARGYELLLHGGGGGIVKLAVTVELPRVGGDGPAANGGVGGQGGHIAQAHPGGCKIHGGIGAHGGKP